MTVIQQQHAIDCHLSGFASVVEVLLSFLLEDLNIINVRLYYHRLDGPYYFGTEI